jgi:hypothetical protein
MTIPATAITPQRIPGSPPPSKPITLDIVQTRISTEGNLPSQFFPGAGSDTAWFQVISRPLPSRSRLIDHLHLECDDYCLMEYDRAKGDGYFVVIDGDAPPAGHLTLPTA